VRTTSIRAWSHSKSTSLPSYIVVTQSVTLGSRDDCALVEAIVGRGPLVPGVTRTPGQGRFAFRAHPLLAKQSVRVLATR